MVAFDLRNFCLVLLVYAVHSSMSLINLNESQVKELLDWPIVYEAVEEALRSVCENRVSEDQPTSNQPARSFTAPTNGLGNINFV